MSFSTGSINFGPGNDISDFPAVEINQKNFAPAKEALNNLKVSFDRVNANFKLFGKSTASHRPIIMKK